MIIALLIGVFLLATALFNKPSVLWVLLAAASFAIYFGFPQIDLMLYLVFILGIGLMIVELYVPDFGIVGLIGLGASVYALYIQAGDVSSLLLDILAMLFTVVIAVVLYLKMGKDLVITPAFVLDTSLTKQEGYSSSNDLSFLLNEKGIAKTDLRPVGRGIFNNKLYEVISNEDFIPNGTSIYVEKVMGSKIYVREDHTHE